MDHEAFPLEQNMHAPINPRGNVTFYLKTPKFRYSGSFSWAMQKYTI